MDNKKRNVQVESDGSRSALVPLWQELPQITVLAGRGVKNKADAVALALFRYRCICTHEAAAVQLLLTEPAHRHRPQYAAKLFYR